MTDTEPVTDTDPEPVAGARPLLRPADRVLCLGDSITQAAGGSREWFGEPAEGSGWLTILTRDLHPYARQVRYVNRGISGNRVPDLLARLDRDVLDAEPSLVIVYIGINDVWHWREGRGTTERAFLDGLAEVYDRLAAAGIRILACTPTVIGERAAGSNPQDDMLGRYVDISRQLARDRRLPCADLHAAFQSELARINTADAESGLLTTDGVHLTEDGNRLVASTLAAALTATEA